MGIESLLGLIPSFVNAGMTALTNSQNIKLQREEWAREDNSVQRRVQDLVKAGLNPVLAAGGQGSPTSLAIKVAPPQLDEGMFQRFAATELTKQQIARTAADTKLAEAQSTPLALAAASNAPVEAYNKLAAEVDSAKANARLAETNAEIRARDAEVYKKYQGLGIPSTISGDVGQVTAILGAALKQLGIKIGE